MGVLTLTIVCHEAGVSKTVQFEPQTVVQDACRVIREKIGKNLYDQPENYGLLKVVDDNQAVVWMDKGRTLEYYLVRNGDTLEYRNKIRTLKVRTMDGGSVKTIQVDESQPVSQLMITVCSKMGISNHDEYSLVRAGGLQNGKDFKQSNTSLNQQYPKESSGFMNTIGRKKEKKIQQLRAKLHTDEEIQWIDHAKTLREQGIPEDEELVLRRKFFFSDTNVDTRDPVQLNLLYLQCRDGIIKGLHPVARDTAIKLAALQCYIEFGPFQEGVQRSLNIKELLPKEYAKAKEHEKNIVQEYKELMFEEAAAPKKKYVQICQSLPTYGVTFFLVKEKVPGKNRLIPRLLGVNKESVMRVDEKTKQVLKEWPLEQVRRWAASHKTFTLDFGDYQERYYSVQTTDGEKIAALIGGYIDIILKKKKMIDHHGIEGDEGSTMLEENVAPAKATLIAHGEINKSSYAQDGHVAIPGVLRSTAGTPGSQQYAGAQYGAVSGMIVSQEVPRAEKIRYSETRERSQRALIGTIEATIRAVEEAEEEISREPDIPLPRFDDAQSRKWRETRVEVEKESVNDRLAAMGAATAEVVQLTAYPEEIDTPRVGSAIATIGSNLPEVGRGVRDLAAIMPDRQRAGDLIEATRRLCGAFGTFLEKVHPETEEKRPVVLSAASKVGELSHEVINTMEEPTREDRVFHDQLINRAKNVATSTAELVLQAKTVSADCESPQLKEQVVSSATQCAFATSQLVACARIVAPTIENETCQEQLTSAAKQVSRTVSDLLIDANTSTQQSTSGRGPELYENLHSAARKVTTALDGLLDHVKTSPRVRRTTTHEDYNYEEVLRSSNRVITHQGASPNDLLRQSESAIRHSRLFVDELHQEAETSPDQRDKLHRAAQLVAQATSNMIDATKECQSRPQDIEPQQSLRTAAQNLAHVTSEVTTTRKTQSTMEQLEKAAKETTSATAQAISAATAAQPYITDKSTTETLIVECRETFQRVSPVVTSIKAAQSAQSPSERFRAHSSLIHETTQLIQPAQRLVETARRTVPSITEQNIASRLHTTSQDLNSQLAELRVALNNAQQSNFEQQLDHTEHLIRELDQELKEIELSSQRGGLQPLPGETSERAGASLHRAAREVSSSLATLISAANVNDRQNVGQSVFETSQALRGFTNAVHGVVSTRSDVHVRDFIVNARSVVHDSGRVFDRVREESNPQILDEAARQVSVSLRQTLACLPDNAHIEKAIEEIRRIDASPIAAHLPPIDIRHAAAKVIEATSDLVTNVRAPQQAGSVEVFVHTYRDFHTSVVQHIQSEPDDRQRHAIREQLDGARDESINVLVRFSAAAADAGNATHTQGLTQSARALQNVVSVIVDRVTTESPWARECDNALRQIQSMRPLLDQASLPINRHTFYESLDSVTDRARLLGEGMTGIAKHARSEDIRSLCESVRTAASAVCGLAEDAAQSAYLIGVGERESQPGHRAIIEVEEVTRSLRVIKQAAGRLRDGPTNQSQVLDDTNEIARHTSHVVQLCRDGSENIRDSSQTNIKQKFITGGHNLAATTSGLINAVKQLDRNFTETNKIETASRAEELILATSNLENFIDNPSFSAVPARISSAGAKAQAPVLQAGRNMIEASTEMIRTSKDLAVSPRDTDTWQRLAENSKYVSESIKNLVGAIRDQAPGREELDRAIHRLNQMIKTIDDSSYAACQEQLPRSVISESRVHEQIQHASQSLIERISPLVRAAISQAEEIAHNVSEHMQLMEPLVQSSIQAASLTDDQRIQQNLFDQCKTVVEAELQMFEATQDSRGNPKATSMHEIVVKSGEQLHEALSDLLQNVSAHETDAGRIHGMVETISRSIALADQTAQQTGENFADTQTRMTNALEEILRIATDMPNAEPEHLGQNSLRLSEAYKLVAEASQIATALLKSPNVAQRLRSAVQKLGGCCMDLVKTAGQRRAHPSDAQVYQSLTISSQRVIDAVHEVLAALHEGSRGTQACINAANTVSGIIGDLDTTILFATSGALNPQRGEADFGSHREIIVKTAKALIEDTKGLVAGAASNQEQLAVAAQNAVRSIVHLSDAVKNGAASLSEDSTESQALVIHAVRDVAAALSGLIQATKNASGRSPNDPAMGNLKEAARIMVTNVTGLLKTVQSVENKSQRGSNALDAAMNAIDIAVRQFDNNEAPSKHKVTPDEVIQTAHGIQNVTSRAGGAASSLNQEEIIATANHARQAVADLLIVTHAIAQRAGNGELKYRTINAGRDVALQVKHLLATLYSLAQRPNDPQTKNNLKLAAQEIAKSVGDLISCSEQFKDTESSYTEKYSNGKDATIYAENELLGAASSIEAASVKLSQLKPRDVPTVGQVSDDLSFDGQILSAAKSIASAVQLLVKAASEAQRELVSQGRLDARPHLSTDDYQWSEGLISAARTVAASVHQLCEAANGLVQGHGTEEKLISAAKHVASSTAHLLVACKVKSDINSTAKQRLQSAGHAVKVATEHLVAAARQAVPQDDRTLVISQQMVSSIAQVMDAQEIVIRKERELYEARNRLAQINKSKYRQSPDDSENQ
jgi:talin